MSESHLHPHPVLVFILALIFFIAISFGVYKLYLFGHGAHDRWVESILAVETQRIASKVDFDIKGGKKGVYTEREVFLATSYYAKQLDSCNMTLETIRDMAQTN